MSPAPAIIHRALPSSSSTESPSRELTKPRAKQPATLALALIFLASGVVGLSYEVVWLRCLSNTIGSSTVATSAILAVFMAGMAIGASVIGRLADRLRRPLIGYAVLELLIGACALVIPRVLPWIPQVAPSSLLLRASVGSFLILVPTFFMGGTIPVLAAHVKRIGGSGAIFTRLYALQVVGAAGGALLASFFLIPSLGLILSSSVGAAVNLLVAVTAVAVARYSAATSTVSAPAGVNTATANGEGGLANRRLIVATAFLSGFVLLGAEVVFVRVLVMSMTAKVHSFALMLTTFLVALSIGSFLVSRMPRRWSGSSVIAGALSLGFLGILVAREVPVHLPLTLLARAFADRTMDPGEYLRFSVLLSMLSLFPLAIPLGMVLPVLLRTAGFAGEESGRAVGRLLGWNTLGCVVGPLVTPYLLISHVGLLGTLYLYACLVAGLALVWLWIAVGQPRTRLTDVAATALVIGVVGLIRAPGRWEGTSQLDATLLIESRIGVELPAEIRHYHEGATGTVAIIEKPNGRRAIRLDGFEAAAVPGRGIQDYQYMRLLAYLPALLHPTGDLEQGLVICCGTGSTAGALAEVCEQVDLVELHQEVLDCLPWFEEANRDLAHRSTVTMIAEDGRAQLRKYDDHYDLITLEPMPPQYASMTQLYSREFYQVCQRALKEDGVVCQWLPWHLVTRTQALAMTRAMAEVFQTVQVWEHRQTGILVGINAPSLEFTTSRLEALVADPEVRSDFRDLSLTDAADVLACFLCDARDLTALATVEPISDDRPVLEYEEFGFGLSMRRPREIADSRAPYVEARSRAEPPVVGLDADEVTGGIVDWQARSVLPYTNYLRRTEGEAATLQYLWATMRTNPLLANHPLINKLRLELER